MPLKINGATSGSVTLAAPATGSDVTLTLPGTSGTAALASALGRQILQIVRVTDSTIRTTTSLTPVDVTGMSVSITPQSASSNILILAAFLQDTAGSGNDQRGLYRITDASNNTILGTPSVGDYVSAVNIQTPITLIGWATPGTTSAQTYKLRFYANRSGVTARVLNGDMTGQVFAFEIGP